MLIHTHKVIAVHIYEYVKNHLNINLNRNFLIYGATKPDIMPNLAIKKHYKEQSFDFVVNEIINLIENGIYENNLSINKFSVKLGVVSHFLSDFFCLPHHNREYFHDKLIEHIKYEKDLHHHFEKFQGLNKIEIPYINEISTEHIKSFVDNLHQSYQSSLVDFSTDIKGSINVSCAISNLIIENSLVIAENKLALL